MGRPWRSDPRSCRARWPITEESAMALLEALGHLRSALEATAGAAPNMPRRARGSSAARAARVFPLACL
jgi:hypothetical protein